MGDGPGGGDGEGGQVGHRARKGGNKFQSRWGGQERHPWGEQIWKPQEDEACLNLLKMQFVFIKLFGGLLKVNSNK